MLDLIILIIIRIIKHRNTLPRAVVEFLSLEVFET